MILLAMSTNAEHIKYLDVNIFNNGFRHAQVELTDTEVEWRRSPLPGTAIVRPMQFGTCTSEIPYYMGVNGDASRFMRDLADHAKQRLYLERAMQAGFTSDPEDIQRAMVHSPFHEGWAFVQEVNPNPSRTAVPIQMYVPVNGTGSTHLERRVVNMNFQHGFEPGNIAILNPALVCDEHSHANNIDPTTGWPYQCNRDTHHGHNPKATRGHTEAIGTAVQGRLRVTFDSMTPLPTALQAYINEDINKRGILATSVEPLACVFQSHGPLLAKNEVPKSAAFIGDGLNALLIAMFYQLYAPDTNIVVVGKNPAKLEVIQQVNPQRIRPVVTDGSHDKTSYDDLSYALEEQTGSRQADVVIPTVALPESTVSPFVREGGMVVWWAASISETATNKSDKAQKPYREFYSYGGAPRAEFSAAAGLDYLVREKPAVLAPIESYPGVFYTDMNHGAANHIQTWLNKKGRFEHPENGLSSKIVVNMH